ncbi:unnamed protein product [Paramecium primaurelia]|uniref:Uncharacterized protein n=1 Tax=Paramecium primaurelia TaxID=5886 RepID=A0A8S1NVE2_PARPR|nr:unnamed protein product [Paramecium primaurelia]
MTSIGYFEIDKNTQIYFNTYDNYLQQKYNILLLFTFNTQIIVYQLKIPQLQQIQQIQQVYAELYNLTFTEGNFYFTQQQI